MMQRNAIESQICVGFAISAILIMVQETFVCSISLMRFLLSLILVTAGFIISYKFDK